MFFRFDSKELTLNDARSSRTMMTLSSDLGRLSIRVEDRNNNCTINITSEDDLQRLKEFIDEHLKTMMPKENYPAKGMGITLFDANGDRIDMESEVRLTDHKPKNYSYELLYSLFQKDAVYALYKLYEGINDDKIKEVVGYCIKEQKKFVTTGNPRFSKKMTLKDVSGELKIDITTVSRCTKDVRIFSPCGKTFTLDNNTCDLENPSLFDDGIGNEEKVSRLEVLDVIKRLVENEDKKKPLSDDELCDKLVKMGYEISRRTVAKYRGDFLGLDPSNQRKQG